MISNRKFSLWLMPQQPQMIELKAQQAHILCANPALPSFEPHITLIGGVEICTCCTMEEIKCIDEQTIGVEEAAAKVVLKKLQSSFNGFGSITCEFDESQGVQAMFNKDGRLKWNQACISVVKQTKNFMDAMKKADDALFGLDSSRLERHFRKPISEPHYSFVYTNDETIAMKLERTLKCPSTFTSTTIAMWWTDPPSLDGVVNNEWKFVGNVYLDRSKL